MNEEENQEKHENEEQNEEHDIIETAMELPGKIVDSITKTVSVEAEKKVEEATESINKTTNYATNMANRKIEEVTSKLKEALPAIERSGYVLHSMDMDIGVLPKIVSRFSVGEAVSDEEKQRILQENKGNRFTYMLLSSLIKASEIKDFVKLGDMKFREIEIHVSTTPKIKLRFAKRL